MPLPLGYLSKIDRSEAGDGFNESYDLSSPLLHINRSNLTDFAASQRRLVTSLVLVPAHGVEPGFPAYETGVLCLWTMQAYWLPRFGSNERHPG
jgi:hypothetical protein